MKGEEWERVDEEEEVVEGDEEVVGDEEEGVLEDGGVAEEDEEVVGRPSGDLVLEYVYGLSAKPPSGLGEWKLPWLLAELRKADALGDRARARRLTRLIFAFCPAKPEACPLYSLSKCPYGLERRCRPTAAARGRSRRREGCYRG